MLSLSIVLAAGYPTDRENRQPAQWVLADRPWTNLTRDLVYGVTPGSGSHKHESGQRALGWCLSS